MASKRFAALLLAGAFLLGGCDRPYFTVLVSNVVGQTLSITRASNSPKGPNFADASPWFWPFRTTPVLAHGRAQTITQYCPNCALSVEIRAGACAMRYEIPASAEGTFQFEQDFLLYRIPAFDGAVVDVRRIPQPVGHPIAPRTQGECG